MGLQQLLNGNYNAIPFLNGKTISQLQALNWKKYENESFVQFFTEIVQITNLFRRLVKGFFPRDAIINDTQ